MVGRLVKQYQVRFAEQYLCQLHPHAPSAAKLTGGSVELFGAEAQAVQCLACLRHVIAATYNTVPFAGRMEAIYQLVVALALIVGSFFYLACKVSYLLFQTSYLGECRESLFHDGGGVTHLHLLFEVSDGEVTRTFNHS